MYRLLALAGYYAGSSLFEIEKETSIALPGTQVALLIYYPSLVVLDNWKLWRNKNVDEKKTT